MDETPQLENGYTRIANEILENMALIKLSPTQYRILFVVWRYTYGFQRKEHELSLTFLEEATQCDKRQIQRELKRLEDRKLIIQKINNGKSRTISFNKNISEWVGVDNFKKITLDEITVGESTIGEIDNGETVNSTIGETVKGAIGEIVKGTIGETTNQERKIKEIYKENIKENIIVLSQLEDEIFKILTTVENYPIDKEKDLDMIKRLKERYPELDLIESIKDWATYKLDKPLKEKDNPRSQINTSCKNYVKWGRNLKESKVTEINKWTNKNNDNKKNYSKKSSSSLDLDHNYDMDQLEKKLLNKSKGG